MLANANITPECYCALRKKVVDLANLVCWLMLISHLNACVQLVLMWSVVRVKNFQSVSKPRIDCLCSTNALTVCIMCDRLVTDTTHVHCGSNCALALSCSQSLLALRLQMTSTRRWKSAGCVAVSSSSMTLHSGSSPTLRASSTWDTPE